MSMMNPHPHHSHHNFRFYVVLFTLVIAGIVFLLYLNDNQSGVSLNSAVVGLGGGSSKDALTTETTTMTINNADLTTEEQKSLLTDSESYGKEIDFTLTSDQTPLAEKSEAIIKSMELELTELNSKINVNGDKLELNNQEEVIMTIKGFSGLFNLNEQGLTLDGTAKVLQINGISLSSSNQIKLSFRSLDFQSLAIEEIELKGISLPNGEGQLKIGEKLTYALEQDELTLGYFNGLLEVDKTAEMGTTLEGVGRSININGALFDLNLK